MLTILFALPIFLGVLIFLAALIWSADTYECDKVNARVHAESFLPVSVKPWHEATPHLTAKQPTVIKVWAFNGQHLNTLTIRPL